MPRKRLLVEVTLGIALIATVGALVELDRFDSREASVSGTAIAAGDPPAINDTIPDDPERAPAAAKDQPQSLGLALLAIRDQIGSVLAAATAATDELTAAIAAEEAATEKARKRAERKAAAKKAAKKRAAKKRSKPSPQRRLTLVTTLGGVTPKSIVSAQNGKVFAMTMMYGHNITVFNKRYKRVKVIDDSVDLSKFGLRRYTEKVQGAPVEAALNPRTGRMYVSNYSMYGAGFGKPGFDLCKSSDKIDRSFVYEIDTKTLRKTDVIRVGEVPKYLAVTPNGRYLLVGNWCSWDISVVDLKKGKEIRRIPAGVAPRGIAFSPNSKTAYVTLVGGDRVLVIDMKTLSVKREILGVGERPRHLVMSPNGRFLYITVQGKDKKRKLNGRILKYDTRKRAIVAQSEALVEPRTTVISDDGKSLYVVDYYPGTIVKLRTKDLSEIQTMYLGYHPIGVTYDKATHKLWVAGYGGQVWVLKDR